MIGVYQRPAPPKRATGVSVNRLAGKPQPPLKTVKVKDDRVLLHYCFNQQEGETKAEHCKCEERADRVSREEAERFVKEGEADWLIVTNARAKSGTSVFHRAIVVRRVNIEGHELFAIPSEWEMRHSTAVRDRRLDKHESIKVPIRAEARDILRKMFAKGLIPQYQFKALADDAALDALLNDRNNPFLPIIKDMKQKRFYDQFLDIVIHWWNNVLGFHKMNVNVESEKLTFVGLDKINIIAGAIETNPTRKPQNAADLEEHPYDNNGGRQVKGEGVDPNRYLRDEVTGGTDSDYGDEPEFEYDKPGSVVEGFDETLEERTEAPPDDAETF
jgi:hypothetical protein